MYWNFSEPKENFNLERAELSESSSGNRITKNRIEDNLIIPHVTAMYLIAMDITISQTYIIMCVFSVSVLTVINFIHYLGLMHL